MSNKELLNQYFTPTWAAELLVKTFYGHLSHKDMVVEPACGDGRFLSAIPSHVPAVGVEIDADYAASAAQYTGA